MDIYVDRKPENCNHCIYKKDVSRYFDLDDYCSKNMRHTSKINMETDCPLRKAKVKKHSIKTFNMLHSRRKAEHKTEDIIQMNTNISLTDKDGKFIEVKTPEPEYIDMIW